MSFLINIAHLLESFINEKYKAFSKTKYDKMLRMFFLHFGFFMASYVIFNPILTFIWEPLLFFPLLVGFLLMFFVKCNKPSCYLVAALMVIGQIFIAFALLFAFLWAVVLASVAYNKDKCN